MACKMVATKMKESPLYGLFVCAAISHYATEILKSTEQEFMESAAKNGLINPQTWYKIAKEMRDAAEG